MVGTTEAIHSQSASQTAPVPHAGTHPGEFSLIPCRVPNPASLLGQLQGSLTPVGCPGEDGKTHSASFAPYFR